MSETKKTKTTRIEARDIKCKVAIMHFEGDLTDIAGMVAEFLSAVMPAAAPQDGGTKKSERAMDDNCKAR